jgi:hypothetical protein
MLLKSENKTAKYPFIEKSLLRCPGEKEDIAVWNSVIPSIPGETGKDRAGPPGPVEGL